MASEPRSGSGDAVVTTAVAIDKDKNSQYAVRWALENVLKKNSYVALLHVQTSQSHDTSIPKEGRAPTDTELHQFFLAFRGFCARKGVRVKEVVLHDIDIASALVDFVTRNSISVLVAGVPTRMALTRAFRGTVDVPSGLAKSAPDFCTVYSVSKGKAVKLKSASRPPTPISAPSTRQMDVEDYNSPVSQSPANPSHHRGRTTAGESRSNFSDFSALSSFHSYSSEMSFENLDHSRTSDGSRNSTSSQNPVSPTCNSLFPSEFKRT